MSPSRNAPAGPEVVAAWLADYVPKKIDRDTWAIVGPFVRPLVANSRPGTLQNAARTIRVLAAISCWCLLEGIPLDPERVLDPGVVERFVAFGLKPSASRATYRSELRRLGPLLTTTAPWEPRPAAVATRKVATPYSTSELAQLKRAATAQATLGRRRMARGLLALGAGVGLDGRWIASVSSPDVVRETGVVLVRVGAPAPRLVPVLDEWEEDVLDLATSAGAATLLGTRLGSTKAVSELTAKLVVGHGHPRFSASRLRSTWLLTHLDRGTRLPELVRAAGLQGITTLSDLLFEVPLLAEQEARLHLRGPSC
jgi:hypothetical protein